MVVVVVVHAPASRGVPAGIRRSLASARGLLHTL